MLEIAIVLAIAGNVGYQVAQKSMAPAADPWIALGAAYVIALGLNAVFFFARSSEPAAALGRSIGWPSLLLGVSIFAIELGFFLAYRGGWQLNIASLLVNVSVALLLIPLARLLFSETLSPSRGLGVVFALVALMLLARD